MKQTKCCERLTVKYGANIMTLLTFHEHHYSVITAQNIATSHIYAHPRYVCNDESVLKLGQFIPPLGGGGRTDNKNNLAFIHALDTLHLQLVNLKQL